MSEKVRTKLEKIRKNPESCRFSSKREALAGRGRRQGVGPGSIHVCCRGEAIQHAFVTPHRGTADCRGARLLVPPTCKTSITSKAALWALEQLSYQGKTKNRMV